MVSRAIRIAKSLVSKEYVGVNLHQNPDRTWWVEYREVREQEWNSKQLNSQTRDQAVQEASEILHCDPGIVSYPRNRGY